MTGIVKCVICWAQLRLSESTWCPPPCLVLGAPGAIPVFRSEHTFCTGIPLQLHSSGLVSLGGRCGQVTRGCRAQAWGSVAGCLAVAELGLVLNQPEDLERLPTMLCSCGAQWA